MTRSEAFPGIYLRKDDVRKAPIAATIADVKMERVQSKKGAAQKPVMRFTEKTVKPLVLTATNWDVLESAYGKDSRDWTGKPIEIYFDPAVKFQGEAMGGLRVRVPALTRLTNGSMPASAPPAEPSAADRVKQALDAFDKLANAERLEQWVKWARETPGLTPAQGAQIEASYQRNRERLTRQLPTPAAASTVTNGSASTTLLARR